MILKERLLTIYKTLLDGAPTNDEMDKHLTEVADLSRMLPEMISFNENLEDISTFSLLLIPIDSFYSQLLHQQRFSSPQERIIQLDKCLLVLSSFLQLVLQLEFIQESVWNELKEILAFTTTNNSEAANIEEVKTIGSRQLSRDQKIQEYRRQKELKVRLQVYIDAIGEKPPREFDDEQTRSFHLLLIENSISSAKDLLSHLSTEYRMLKSMAAKGFPVAAEYPQNQGSGASPRNPTNALMDSKGKIMQPFVITSRSQQVSDVFKPGHRLPSLTIDEYLERERERGNIISGGGANKQQPPKDPEQEEDQKEFDEIGIYKKREWDDYKDLNPKGWGNTAGNRG